MKWYIISFFLVLSAVFKSNAQTQNSIWCFGDSAGIDFSNVGGPIPISSGMDGRGSSVSMCDDNGQLLFYAFSRATFGPYSSVAYNRDHVTMLNGDSIIAIGWYNELLAIGLPANDSLYYIFSINGVSSSMPHGLFYSIINMQLDSTKGAVVSKNIQLQNFRMVDCLSAVKHGNGRDWWIVFRRHDPSTTSPIDEWHTYLVTDQGPINYFVQHIGAGTKTNSGYTVFSIDGEKMAFVDLRGVIEIYDFDRCTGLLSNNIIIENDPNMAPYKFYFSCAFSPNSNLLYVSSSIPTMNDSSYLFQYNLLSPNIALSKDTIWGGAFPIAGGNMKIGPDNRIYLSCAYDPGTGFNYPYEDSVRNYINENLSVINNPDSIGIGCDFQPFSFYLGGKRTYYGLSNNPDYELGPLVGSPCDTITSAISQQPIANRGLALTYMFSWQKLFVNAEGIRGRQAVLEVYDMNGRLVYRGEKATTPPYFTQDVNVASLSSGVYVVSLTTEHESLLGKFVKQ